MRTQATIIRDGNGIERESWSDMKDYFPSYEKFWATHIVPLRSAGTKTIRDGVEPTLEEIAMLHYSCYMNLCRAWKKAKDKEQLRFFPEIYANLVSASTLAIRLLKRFESLCSACDCEFQAGHDRELGAFTQKELKPYRNALHDPLSGYRKSLDGLFYVPKKEKFRKSDDRRIYPRWSETYHYATSEFVSINEQFEWDFKELCDHFEACWKEMLNLTEKMQASAGYQSRITSGTEFTISTIGSGALSTDSAHLGLINPPHKKAYRGSFE